MAKLSDYLELGQSIWLDDIRREYFTTGELARLVSLGLRGLTSNPSIFEKAIVGSSDYDAELRELVRAGKSLQEIYEALTMADIRQAADVLRPVYDESAGADGFVSLEVNPKLAHDTDRTAAEAVRLFTSVDRPNLMIKIPGTPEGIPAIQTALGQGVNVNVTLIFSVAQYEAVAQAHMAGLEDRLNGAGDISRIGSVASFFVSRVDNVVDKKLEEIGETDLLGKIAIANSKAAYACFQDLYSSERWKRLAAEGGRVQRQLWASTSTKNPNYPDTLYVDALIGPDTVNTLPYTTIEAALDHGVVERTLDQDAQTAHAQIARLGELGIDLEAVTEKLQHDGVAAFARSFESLMEGISRKRESIRAGLLGFSASPGSFQAKIEASLAELDEKRIVQRIWEKDHTVWKPDPTEIANRLGWLHSAEALQKELPAIESLVERVREDGYTHALLLGMGGSSLAPEVFRKSFGVRAGYLDLAVLDSTDPGAVLEFANRLDPAKTLYIVSSKSGGTIETASFFKFFYNQVCEALGADLAVPGKPGLAKPGEHFIAITDPGSKVAQTAGELGFRAVFLNDPEIGGRYSALSHFGLVPAALMGIDLRILLQRAVGMADHCANASPASANRGASLGAIIGEMARQGRDKLTVIPSAEICSFGDWAEQLIAESTGKEGRGVLPVVGEVIGEPEVYRDDRIFVYLRLGDDHSFDVPVLALEYAGQPVLRLEMEDLYDLGGQFFLWEFATAVAGSLLAIQPFDQPNVESAKIQARKMVQAYQEKGELPALKPAFQSDGITVYGDIVGNSLAEIWDNFLAKAQPNAYIALQAYVPWSPASDASLLALRTRLRELTKLAVTTGYGPRFLHSTGQLHKGGSGVGLFVQITHTPELDVSIPDEAGGEDSSISFGVLEMAQALGDRQALLDNGRDVLRFHFDQDVQVGLTRLVHSLRG
jgi:transaldolase/glucose-6-phosphate isomerase